MNSNLPTLGGQFRGLNKSKWKENNNTIKALKINSLYHWKTDFTVKKIVRKLLANKK